MVMRYESADYFGELALLSDKPRAATVKATANTTCYRVERDDFVLLRKYVSGAKEALYAGMCLLLCIPPYVTSLEVVTTIVRAPFRYHTERRR
eukprot:COSAG01_NODE_7488_length_3189_cov_1.847573_3_plen_93_part_00